MDHRYSDMDTAIERFNALSPEAQASAYSLLEGIRYGSPDGIERHWSAIRMVVKAISALPPAERQAARHHIWRKVVMVDLHAEEFRRFGRALTAR